MLTNTRIVCEKCGQVTSEAPVRKGSEFEYMNSQQVIVNADAHSRVCPGRPLSESDALMAASVGKNARTAANEARDLEVFRQFCATIGLKPKRPKGHV